MKNLTIIIPAFNEESGIKETLIKLKPYANKNSWKVFVVNDGSTDNTKNVIEKYDFVEITSHKVNRGYGASLKTGINNCKTEYLAFYDADGQHKPEDMERLWTEYEDEDMIVGQRIKGSHISISRTPGKWILSLTANFLTGQKIPDLNSGLRIVKRDIIEKYLHLFPDGFSFSTTSTIALLSNRHVVSYKPIQTNKRIGKSHLSIFKDG